MKTFWGVVLAWGALTPMLAHAQIPSAYQGNIGDWALGRWDGYILARGPSGALKRDTRHLIVRKDDAGNVTCLWFINEPTKNSPTKRCAIGSTEISLETSASSEVELWRSGPDGMQGTFKAERSSGPNGTQIHLNRSR